MIKPASNTETLRRFRNLKLKIEVLGHTLKQTLQVRQKNKEKVRQKEKKFKSKLGKQ